MKNECIVYSEYMHMKGAQTAMNRDIEESWELFMKLCEEFPELYDKYAEKTEQELKNYRPPFEITEEDRQQALQKLRERIRKED